ncbi:Dyp-type peroxidase [Kitasatospora sp. NPDC058201]|uniref:Dyp-type peroxidase n=1 Tax=Streptomycetaceae TaxID=2062 RepID=UPI002E797AD6|nr:Dyp-type peroxidase [Streptomyces sp. BE303]MED7947887.1 Dyp-type peroxidase [Streptomyces sp. BE303]
MPSVPPPSAARLPAADPAPPADPPDAQPVLAPLTSAAIFLVLTVDPGGEQTVRALLPDLAGLRRSVGFRAPDAGLTCVTGIGSDAWDRLFAGPRPAALHPFREVAGARHRAPATPGDLLFHLRAARMDLCFELAGQLTRRLAGAATVVDAVHGFRYFDDRDLLGFVDGTENPEGRAADAAVRVGPEDPEFAGGSYVVVQKYLHDLDAWNRLPVEAQERAVGRTKLTDIELDDDSQPADSHVSLTTITGPDGEERQIMRFNMAFGSFEDGGEFGTYFIGYARDPEVTEEMLRNMFVGRPPGAYDRLLDVSTAVTGTLFHVPTADFLDDPPPAPAADTADAPPVPAAPPRAPSLASFDGSLAIGSLKETPSR